MGIPLDDVQFSVWYITLNCPPWTPPTARQGTLSWRPIPSIRIAFESDIGTPYISFDVHDRIRYPIYRDFRYPQIRTNSTDGIYLFLAFALTILVPDMILTNTR